MKASFTKNLLLFMSIVSGVNAQNCPNISGHVTYMNSEVTPLYAVHVSLKTMSGEVLQTTTTDYLGRYSFCQPEEGQYEIKLSCDMPTGGINTIDVLQVLWVFVGLINLDRLVSEAADVSNDGVIHTTDALLILKRYVEQIATFPAGDWVFESGIATVTSESTVELNLKGLCYGDVDASYIPTPCSPMPTMSNAGQDQTVEGSTTTLSGNEPEYGNGSWIIITGTGGIVVEPNNPSSTFTGTQDSTYTLVWEISTDCASSRDTVNIMFTNPPYVCGTYTFTYGGKTYNTVQIGNQCWMRENLNIGKMVTSLTTSSSHSECSNNGTIEKYCYNNDSANCAIYGGLYDWNEIMQYTTIPGGRGICPTGWHIPTDEEFCTLSTYLDLNANCNAYGVESYMAGGKMKETGFTLWSSPNTGATNETGFSALGGGYRNSTGGFYYFSNNASFWSSSEASTGVVSRRLYSGSACLYRSNDNETSGFSVRCVRN